MHLHQSARIQKCAGIVLPTCLIEVRRQEETGFVYQHRVNASYELMTRAVLAGQVPTNSLVIQRKQMAVRTVCAFDSRLFADTPNPFLAASRRIPRVTCFATYKAASINIRASAKQRTEQRNLFVSGGTIVDHACRFHSLYNSAHQQPNYHLSFSIISCNAVSVRSSRSSLRERKSDNRSTKPSSAKSAGGYHQTSTSLASGSCAGTSTILCF